MRFNMTQIAGGSQFQFSLLNNAGVSVLTSPPFRNSDACMSAIQELIQVLPDGESYTIGSQGSSFNFSISNEADRLLATSPSFPTQKAAQTAQDALIEDADDETNYSVDVSTLTTVTTTGSQRLELPPLKDIDFASMYDLAFLSTTSKSGFESFFRAEKNAHYFHFNDASGDALVYSRGFDTGGRRDKRIRQVIAATSKATRYEVKEDGNRFFFILKEKNGLEIARSRYFTNRADANSAVTFIQGSAPAYTEQYPEPDKKKKGNEYDFEVPSTGATGFDALRHKKQSYFILNDNTRPILYSQSYAGNGGRDNGIKAVIKGAGVATNYELKEDKKTKKYYFILRGSNKNEIAHSAYFDTLEDRQNAMDWMLKNVSSYATKYNVDFTENVKTTTKTTTQTETISLNVNRPVKPVVEVAKPVEAMVEPPKAAEPVVDLKAAAALAATVAAAAIAKVEMPKVVEKIVEKVPEVPKIVEKAAEPLVFKPYVPPVAKVAAPIVEEVAASGGFRWWWIVLPLLLIGVMYMLLGKGCSGEPKMAAAPKIETLPPAPVVVETPKATVPTPAPTVAPVAAKSCDLNWLLFDFDKYNLLEDSKTELDELAKILKGNKDYVAILHAHTDAKGTVAYNDKLSTNRANEAKQYLIKLGIVADRIKTTASGKSSPFAQNTNDDAGRRFNRRVELFIQNKEGKNVCESTPPDVPTALKVN